MTFLFLFTTTLAKEKVLAGTGAETHCKFFDNPGSDTRAVVNSIEQDDCKKKILGHFFCCQEALGSWTTYQKYSTVASY